MIRSCPGWFRELAIGSGFFPPTEPQDGDFVAWNGFDGDGPMRFTMYQDIVIPADAPAATLEWQDRVQWEFFTPDAEARAYEVQIRDPSTNGVLDTLFSFSTGPESTNPFGDTGWQTHTADVSAFAGSTVRLFIEETIPESFTGPGQIEFDDFKLDVGTNGNGRRPTNVDSFIANFKAPAKGTYYARVTGSPDTDYSLVVMRNAEFGLEDNDSIDSAQKVQSKRERVLNTQWVLGSIESTNTTLYASSRFGDLFTIDVNTGEGDFVGLLPGFGATEIEYSNESGRAFVQFPDGFFAGQEFDIDTGAGIGDFIFNDAAFNGLEYVGSTLYGTAIEIPGGPSTLRILDPFVGTSVVIGPTGVGPVSGLAYDQAAGVMYGIAGGPGPADLFTIDLGTGTATVVGSTGIQAGSLQLARTASYTVAEQVPTRATSIGSTQIRVPASWWGPRDSLKSRDSHCARANRTAIITASN